MPRGAVQGVAWDRHINRRAHRDVEELPEELRRGLELFREMRRPRKRIGYMRVKGVIGELHGREDKG